MAKERTNSHIGLAQGAVSAQDRQIEAAERLEAEQGRLGRIWMAVVKQRLAQARAHTKAVRQKRSVPITSAPGILRVGWKGG